MTSTLKYLTLLVLGLALNACGDKEALKNNYSLLTDATKNTIVKGNPISFSLKAKKDITVDSVVYFTNGKRIASQPNTSVFKTTLESKKLGYKNIEARVYTPDGKTSATVKVIVLNDKAPKVYGYK